MHCPFLSVSTTDVGDSATETKGTVTMVEQGSIHIWISYKIEQQYHI